MSVSIIFNGVAYTIPETDDENWGDSVTNFLVSIPSGALQPTSTSFTLVTGDLNFGTNYGLVSKYFKSTTASIAAAGAIRLANIDSLSWRNGTNNADLALSVSATNELLFNGAPIISSGGTTWGLIAGILSDQTDLQAALDSISAIALESATTTIDVSSATAPSSGQVLTATSDSSATWQTPTPGHIIQEEGTPLTDRANLNFVGSEITVTDDAGNNATKVTLAAWKEDHFTASGSTAAFTLSQTPKSTAGISAYINGLLRWYTTDYAVSGTTATFTFTPDANDLVTFRYQY
jgi:hypothetical protein